MPRRNLKLEERKDIVINLGSLTPRELACRYKISLSQTYRILGNKEYYLDLCGRVNNKLTRIRAESVDLDHDDEVLKFLESNREAGIPLNGMIIRKAAAKMKGAAMMSYSWWTNFKRRHRITYGMICGELKSANAEAAEEFKVHSIPILLQSYTNALELRRDTSLLEDAT